MANKKISALTELTTVANGDLIPIIDISDTTDSANGTTKKITKANLIVGGSGSGDVVGPSSATDNAIARFDTTTGKLIQNSGATIDDSGNITGNNLSGTNTGNETTTTTGSLINGATEKTTPIDADMVGLMDSAAANILKKLSWANIKATLKTYFDTLYANIAGSISQSFSASSIELGHATDTTIARSGAGDITIEGNGVYRAGGTDVAIADGGTGASTAVTAMTNLAFQSRSRAYRSTAQTIATATWTKVQLNSESYDILSEFDNVTNYRWTAGATGTYHIDFSLAINMTTAGRQMSVDIRKNGAGGLYFQDWVNSASSVPFIGSSTDIELTAGDYLEMWVYQGDVGNQDIYASGNEFFTFLNIRRVA